jgi:hypothetical protein
MRVKEAIYELVARLDDAQALAVLKFVRLVAEQQPSAGDVEPASAEPRPVELVKAGRPTSDDDPLWNIVGMIGEEFDVPTDMAANHDRYLAEIYARRQES